MDYTFSPFTFKWVNINSIFRFYFKNDINKFKGKLIGVLIIKILLFINNKNKSINVGDLNYNRP